MDKRGVRGARTVPHARINVVLWSTRPRALHARAPILNVLYPKLVLSITPEPLIAQKSITPQIKAHDEPYHLHTLVQPGGPSPGCGGASLGERGSITRKPSVAQPWDQL